LDERLQAASGLNKQSHQGDIPMNSRRKFLTLFGMVAAVSAASLRLWAGVSIQAPASQKVPGQKTNDDDLPEKPPTKGILDANEKDIKKKIEKLFELATDLKEQVEKTDSSKVLSLVLVKKAEEIEKLARDIKTKAKG
jgi:hypothetical protein